MEFEAAVSTLEDAPTGTRTVTSWEDHLSVSHAPPRGGELVGDHPSGSVGVRAIVI